MQHSLNVPIFGGGTRYDAFGHTSQFPCRKHLSRDGKAVRWVRVVRPDVGASALPSRPPRAAPPQPYRSQHATFPRSSALQSPAAATTHAIPTISASASATSGTSIGLCGLPGVVSPALLTDYWRLRVRPLLDALLRATSREPPGCGFLNLLDRLLAELRSTAALARHTAAHHVDATWRNAAAEVAAACVKYDIFIFQAADSDLLSKLDMTAQRLAAQLQALRAEQAEVEEEKEEREGQADEAADELRLQCPGLSGLDTRGEQGVPREDSGCGSAVPELQQPLRPSAGHVADGRQAGAEAESVAERRRSGSSRRRRRGRREYWELHRLLRLCVLLRRSLLRGGAGLEDEGELSRLYAVRTAPSGAQERLSRLMAAERDAAAAVDAAVAAGPGPLALPLAELRRAMRIEQLSRPRGQAGSRDDVDDLEEYDEYDGHDIGGLQGDDVLRRDPILGPMLAAAAAAGIPSSVGLPLTPGNLRVLLRRHPYGTVRRAAYEAGLLPRLAVALQRMGGLAAVRGKLAALQGYSSFAEMSYSRAGLAVADPNAVFEFLQAMAEVLRPLAEAEVMQLRIALAAEGAEAEAERMESGGHGGERCGDDATGGSSEATAQPCEDDGQRQAEEVPRACDPPELAAWDVDYARELLMRRLGLPPEPAELQPYMTLHGVLCGLSELLCDLLDVRLEVGEGQPTAPAELWDPRVVRVTVWSEHGLAGVVYLDPGTGYGTRQLRFPVGTPAVHGVGGGGAAASAPAPSPAALEAAGEGGGAGGFEVQGGGDRAGSGAVTFESVAVVAVGLQWEWRGGCAENPQALHELLHEMGHALHLLLACAPRDAASGAVVPATPTASGPVLGAGAGTGGGGSGGPGALLMHWGGLQLPPDLLEVPSSLLQTLAYDSSALARICRRRRGAQPRRAVMQRRGPQLAASSRIESSPIAHAAGPPAAAAPSARNGGGGAAAAAAGWGWNAVLNAVEEDEDGSRSRSDARESAEAADEVGSKVEEHEEEEEEDEEAMPGELCERVAAFLAAENCGPVSTLHKVLASLVDQLLHGAELPEAQQQDVGLVWQAVRQAYGVLPYCPATLKELAALPALAHCPATFHAYLVGLAAASAVRRAHPLLPPPPPPPPPRDLRQIPPSQPLPVGAPSADAPLESSHRCTRSAAWGEVRRRVFEAGGGDEPAALLAGMTGQSLQQLGAAERRWVMGSLADGLEAAAPVMHGLADLADAAFRAAREDGVGVGSEGRG